MIFISFKYIRDIFIKCSLIFQSIKTSYNMNKLIIKFYKAEIIGAIAFLALGMLSGYISKPENYGWYSNLQKPYFTPPKWVFEPVWSILYLLCGVAFAKIKRLKEETTSNIFIIHFILNLLWSPLFFLF